LSHFQRATKTYLIRNRSTQDRQLIIEHPVREDWTLAEPTKPMERSRDFYRFAVAVPTGKAIPFRVVEEKPHMSQFEVRYLNPNSRGRYATGLGVHVEIGSQETNEKLQKLHIERGVLRADYEVRRAQNYILTNRTAEAIQVQVEHRVDGPWKVISPAKAEEVAANIYRFRQTVASGQTAVLAAQEERPRIDDLPLVRADEKVLRKLQESPVASAAVKAVLEKLPSQRAGLARTRQALVDLEEQLKAIGDDQMRLRANLDKVPPTSAAYKRYLAKFDDQETEIEKLQMQIKELKKTEKQQQKEAADYLAELSVD
jgi:hypothetical protein